MQPSAIILTGSSSTGKATTGRAIVRTWNRPVLFLDADEVLANFDYQRFKAVFVRELNDGLFRSAVAFLDAGLSVVVEQVFWSMELLTDAARSLAGRHAWLVQLTCNDEVARSRETARGNRPAGMHGITPAVNLEEVMPDFIVDTSVLTPSEAAFAVLAQCADIMPTAFARIDETRAQDR